MSSKAAINLYIREHEAGLHENWRPPRCTDCHGNSATLVPMPIPPTESHQHPEQEPPRRGRTHSFRSLGEAIENLRGRGLGFKATEPEPEPTEPCSPVDGGPMCTTCNGWRRVRREHLSLGDEAFGKALPCPDCQTFVSDTRVHRFWANAGLPQDTQGLGLDTYPTSDARQRQCLNHLRLYLELDADQGKWTFLWGPPSVGKTVLGAALAREFISRRQCQATFQTVGKLIDRLRASQRSDEGPTVDDLLSALETAPILMLDDLGVQVTTEFVREKLFRLIDERKNHRLVTIITSNFSLDELEQSLGERIVDRIEQQSVIIHVDGPNLRRDAGFTESVVVVPLRRAMGARA